MREDREDRRADQEDSLHIKEAVEELAREKQKADRNEKKRQKALADEREERERINLKQIHDDKVNVSLHHIKGWSLFRLLQLLKIQLLFYDFICF